LNDEKLARTLQSVGQACFVRFFGEFYSTNLSREDVINKLRAETDYTEDSCISRVGHARGIVNSGLSASALNLVISSNSKIVSLETRAIAREWLVRIQDE
jgi:hypothetical protein